MYKQSSPEALSLASLGRADSKPPDRTCRGITTVGKPCRKPLKKGTRDKYCHLHKEQSGTFQGELTTTVVEEYDSPSEAHRVRPQMHVKDTATVSWNMYPTPSPSPPRKASPIRKPVPSIWHPPQSRVDAPSMQLSHPARSAPPTWLSSSHLITQTPVQRQNGGMSKLGIVVRRIFRLHSKKSAPTSVKYPSLGTTFRRNDELGPSRYPQIISPSTLPLSDPHKRLPPSPMATPPRQQPPQNQILLPSPQRTPKNSTSSNVPLIQSRPPTSAMAMAQSRTRAGIEKSWETMWVPGANGYGAYITCNGTPPTFTR